jgi:DNA modification methylase
LKLHPCPKAVEEMLFLVDALTSPGQVVLDPFAGSGSTLVAAALLNRMYIGCDVSERYCRLAKKRLADLGLAIGAGT